MITNQLCKSLQFLNNTIPLVNTKDPTIQNVSKITLFKITPNIFISTDTHKINTPYACVNIISVALLSIQLEPTYEEERILCISLHMYLLQMSQICFSCFLKI